VDFIRKLGHRGFAVIAVERGLLPGGGDHSNQRICDWVLAPAASSQAVQAGPGNGRVSAAQLWPWI